MNQPPLPAHELAQWRDCLKRLATAEPPKGSNVPNSRALVFLIFTCDDGLDNTKSWNRRMPEEMSVLLERMFPGREDEQKYALLMAMAATAEAMIGTEHDVLGARGSPSAMEWLEAECVARVPSRPDDPRKSERWQRLADMRLEYLFGPAETWTGAMQPVEKSPNKGKYRKGHGAQRAKLLPVACDAIVKIWLERLDAEVRKHRQTAAPRAGEPRRRRVWPDHDLTGQG